MTKLLLLGTSLISTEIVQTAKDMGCYVIVTDNLPPERSYAKLEADEYWMISTNEIDLLEQKCREENVNAVFSGVSEFNLDRVKQLAGRLNLPCYIEDEPWKYARNKQLFKEKCKEIGIPVVDEYTLSDPPCRDEMNKIEYPVVVKPVDGSGNRGVSICYNEEEMLEAYQKARTISEKDILVERYITGEESWNNFYVAENEICCVARNRAFKQPGYPTFLYSIGVSAMEDNQEFMEQINEKCVKLFRSIGCRNGIAWIQFIRDANGRYYAIEMAHRMNAGETSTLNEEGQGFNPVRWMLDTALGIEHRAAMIPALRQPPYKKAYCLYFLFADRPGIVCSMKGFKELDKNRFLISNVVQEGDHINRYNLISRIAFNAQNSTDLCDTIRMINEKVRILDENGENIYIQYNNIDILSKSVEGLFLS
ncbi:MAG: ATP-grasp domain-containing protein [Clostridia bacterium]|nr:ATP-grasp domain-containing protein [Clostridia bacterium]